jgi:glycosyltransferase involved in cell wall biosynthesis
LSDPQTGSPVVSVLVTVYNRAHYVAECLASILASSFGNFEVIVVDDASTDSSHTIALDFASRDSRIRPFRNDANLGDYGNRMKAATLARGRYIKYLDSDDVIYEHGLSVMVQAMEASPIAALGISHSAPEGARPYPLMMSPVETWKQEFLGVGALGAGPSGAIVRRDPFFEVGGFRDWGVLSDTDLWYRMSARWPVVLLPPGLVWWRRHEDQEFSRGNAEIVYLEKGYQLTLDALASADSPLTAGETREARERASQHYARKLLSLAIRRARPADALRMMRRSQLSLGDVISGFAAYR